MACNCKRRAAVNTAKQVVKKAPLKQKGSKTTSGVKRIIRRVNH